MSSDNLSRLALKLLGTPLAEDGIVLVGSDDYKSLTEKLDPGLASDVTNLVEGVASLIPNDFGFNFFFDVEGVELSIEFEDGNVTSDAGCFRFTSRKSMMKRIRSIDWDTERGAQIQRGGIFEELGSKAEDRPVNIPSSKEAAEKYSSALAAAFNRLKEHPEPEPFAMVSIQDEEAILEIQNLPDRPNLVFEMGDAMATGYEILAILENGATWPFEKIEEAKLEAVAQLGPISRAKAERRFLVP